MLTVNIADIDGYDIPRFFFFGLELNFEMFYTTSALVIVWQRLNHRVCLYAMFIYFMCIFIPEYKTASFRHFFPHSRFRNVKNCYDNHHDD